MFLMFMATVSCLNASEHVFRISCSLGVSSERGTPRRYCQLQVKYSAYPASCPDAVDVHSVSIGLVGYSGNVWQVFPCEVEDGSNKKKKTG